VVRVEANLEMVSSSLTSTTSPPLTRTTRYSYIYTMSSDEEDTRGGRSADDDVALPKATVNKLIQGKPLTTSL